MKSNSKSVSKILVCVLLVALLVIGTFTLVACNKKKGGSTAPYTSTDPVTGQTVLNLDNVPVQASTTLSESYTDITMDTKYISTGDYISAPNGLKIIVVLDSTSTDTNGNVYYLYDVYNKRIINQDIAFAYYYTNSYMSYGNNYSDRVYYFRVGHKNDTTSSCSAYSIDLYGNIMAVYTGAITSNYQLSYADALNPTYNATKKTDATFGDYIIVTYKTISETKQYRVSIEDYSREEYTGEVLPTFAANDKYAERIAVPGLSGYYYYESAATNQILFFNRYNATTAVSVLNLDFGLSLVTNKVIANGKVFLLTEGTVPNDSTDYDYVEAIGPLENKLQNRFYVFDIPTGAMTRLFAGYIVDNNFKVFTANNNKPYVSVKLKGIQNYFVCRSYMYYVADADGNLLVSTPNLFDIEDVMIAFISNNQKYYAYDIGAQTYLLDQNLNTLSTINNVTLAGNNFLVAHDDAAKQYYVFDLNKNIKIASITDDTINDIEVYGDFVLCEEKSGDCVVYNMRDENTFSNPIVIYQYNNVTTCGYIGNGIFRIDTLNTNGYYKYQFINAKNTEILSVDNVYQDYGQDSYNERTVVSLQVYDEATTNFIDKLYIL